MCFIAFINHNSFFFGDVKSNIRKLTEAIKRRISTNLQALDVNGKFVLSDDLFGPIRKVLSRRRAAVFVELWLT